MTVFRIYLSFIFIPPELSLADAPEEKANTTDDGEEAGEAARKAGVRAEGRGGAQAGPQTSRGRTRAQARPDRWEKRGRDRRAEEARGSAHRVRENKELKYNF